MKEETIHFGRYEVRLFITYFSDGAIDDIYIEYLADGHHVTWSLDHRHGQIKIVDMGSRTKDWGIFKLVAPKELALEVLKYINGEK